MALELYVRPTGIHYRPWVLCGEGVKPCYYESQRAAAGYAAILGRKLGATVIVFKVDGKTVKERIEYGGGDTEAGEGASSAA
jgi:hypothetical protein